MDDEWISESRQEVSEKRRREEERNKKTGRHSPHTHTHPRSFNSFTEHRTAHLDTQRPARNLFSHALRLGLWRMFSTPWGRERLSSHWRDGRSSCMFVDPSGSSSLSLFPSLSGKSRSSKGYCSKRKCPRILLSHPGRRRDTNEVRSKEKERVTWYIVPDQGGHISRSHY